MAKFDHYLRPAPRAIIWLTVTIFLLFAAAGRLAMLAAEHHALTTALTQHAEVLRKVNRKPVTPKVSKAEAEERRRWTTLQTERSFNWQPLFLAVERAGSNDIELLAFQPDKRARLVLLRGEGRDVSAVVAFLDRLSRQRVLRDVHLTSQKSNVRGQLTSVSFEIKAFFS